MAEYFVLEITVHVILWTLILINNITLTYNLHLYAWIDEVLNGPKATVFYTTGDQGEEKEFSREEVEEMMKSDAYQRKIDTCHL